MYQAQEHASYYDLSKELLKSPTSVDDIELLRDVLRYHEWKYYVVNDPVISDYEYDVLYKQLVELERAHPELISPDSPTQRVSPDLTSEFPSVPHLTPMLSLDNSYNAEDLLKFDEQVRKLTQSSADRKITYCVEPKFDGGSIALVYEDDRLLRAATRGNGFFGEEITPNARILPSIPLRASFSKHGIKRAEIRGEAVISKEKFEQLNRERASQDLTLLANPRNSAAGGLRTKDPQETRNREIEVFAFHLSYAEDEQGGDALQKVDNHFDQMQLLYNLGFKTANVSTLKAKDIHAVIDKVSAWEGKRDDFPYEIDGAVVKVNEVVLQELCGSTQHHPRWAVAYKFKAKQATTTLLDVEYQVGKIGSITPVAKVEPVHIAGVTVSSISLHNEEFIRSRDLRLGDKIIIERAGDVIPYIVKSLEDLRDGTEVPIIFPTHCPVNDRAEKIALVREEGEAAWRCPDCICGAQDLQKIIFHVSKEAMDIDGFGKANVERFYNLGWIKNISDVYDLDYEKIEKLEGFGKRSAEKLKKSIEKAKRNPLSKLLHSLSIHHLGKKASGIIASEIGDIFELQNWTEDDFIRIRDIGPVVARNVMRYFSRHDNIDMLKQMEAMGVNIRQSEDDRPPEISPDAPLAGKTILFTGSLQKMTRLEAKKLAEKSGAKNLSAVSSNLDILVVGENAGSKLKKATDLGSVQILSEEEFLNIVS